MWEKKERPELSDLYHEQNIDEMLGFQLHPARKVDATEQMPEGLREQLKLLDEEPLLDIAPTGGRDEQLANLYPCKCE